MPDVDNLLTSFYQLDDEARSEIIATIKMMLQYHKDEKEPSILKISRAGKWISSRFPVREFAYIPLILGHIYRTYRPYIIEK